MRANDIDLAYAEDGRTLQTARLVENAIGPAAGREGEARTADRRQGDRHHDGARRRDGDQPHRERERPGGSAAGRRHAGAADPVGVAHGDGRARGRHPGGDLPRQRRVSREPRRARQARGDRSHREVRSHGHQDQAGVRRPRARRLPQQRASSPTARRPRPRRRRAVYAIARGSARSEPRRRATPAAVRTSPTAASASTRATSRWA